MKNILFLIENNDTQLQMFLPVIKQLKTTSDINPIIVSFVEICGRRLDKEKLKKEDVEDVKVVRCCSDTINREYWKKDLFQKFLIYKRFHREIGESFKKLKPDLVICGGDGSIPVRYFIKESNRHHIPSIMVQDGMFTLGIRFSFFYTLGLKLKRIIFYPAKFILGVDPTSFYVHYIGGSKCSKIAVWGNSSREYFLKAGVPSEKIIITGQPRFDQIFTTNWQKETSSFLKKYSLNENYRYVIFLSQPIEKFGLSTTKKKEEAIIETIHSIQYINRNYNSNFHLIIKLHREDNFLKIKNLVSRIDINKECKVLQDVNLYPLLFKGELAITFFSTSGLEALLFEKPLITLNFSGCPDNFDYSKKGVAIGVSNPQNLKLAIAKALFNNEAQKRLSRLRKRYLLNQVYALDGKSTMRVVKLIKKMLLT